MMLRFLTENGRNRSNSRQLSEILFFVMRMCWREKTRIFTHWRKKGFGSTWHTPAPKQIYTFI